MGDHHNHLHEKKTGIVVLIASITMVSEIFFGITSNSMALLADGIHMGSHVLALGLSWLAYFLIRKYSKLSTVSFSETKCLSLSGFTSGLILIVFAIFILVEAINRLLHPLEINYKEAIIVAVIGLVVNLLSALILHHDEEHSDHNIKAAYIHVLADALTSITAIVGLAAAWYKGWFFLDTIGAIISSFVIIKWSIGLINVSGKVLVEFDIMKPPQVS